MNTKEGLDKLFLPQFRNAYIPLLDQIREYLINHENIKIEDMNLGIEDILEKLNNKDYLNGEEIFISENGIKTIISSDEFWESIKNYINPSVKTLEVPFSLIENDLSFLSRFKNLETLILNGYNSLSLEDIKRLKEAGIKKVEASVFTFMYEDLLNEKGTAILTGEFSTLYYKGLTVYDRVKKLSDKKKTSLYMEVNLIDEEILKILDKEVNFNDIESIRIKDYFGTLVDIDLSNKIESNVSVHGEYEKIFPFFSYLKNKGFTISQVTIDIGDINYDKDYSLLGEISKQFDLNIKYSGGLGNASYEELEALLDSIKWYKSIINEFNLSPLEKLMFAYDIMKTFTYKASQESYISRSPHSIIQSGNIVCVGYAQMLNEIIRGIDYNISSISTGVDCYDKDKNFLSGHSRNLVKIDDDKYNVHGIFVLDSTWDSNKTQKEALEILGKDYVSLDLYRYFLIPYSDYAKTFENDSLPLLFKENASEYIEDNVKSLFGKEVATEDINRYLGASRPSINVIKEALYNVRMAEGYTSEEAQKEVDRITLLNKKVIEHMREQGNSIEYFHEESTKNNLR